MSDELVLTEVLTAQPAELEQRLATAMRGIGRRIAESPEIVRALTACEQLKDGYVIADETQAADVADLVAQVIDGEKELADQAKAALLIPKAMEAALKAAIEPERGRLAAARLVGNTARVAWQSELRRLAAREEEKRRQEAREEASRAAVEAAETGEDTPPEVEVATVEVPRTVSGGTGKMGTAIRIEAFEIVEIGSVPRDWLVLVSASAKAGFLAAERAGLVKKPAPGDSIVYKGVRFEARENAVNRR